MNLFYRKLCLSVYRMMSLLLNQSIRSSCNFSIIYQKLIETISPSNFFHFLSCCLFHDMSIKRYATVMFSTGPMYITHEASNYVNHSSIDVLSQDLYGKYAHNSTRALFKHLKGKINKISANDLLINIFCFSFFVASSWHGNDAALVKWIYRRRIILLSSLVVLFTVVLAIIYLVHHRHSVVNLAKKLFSKEKFKYEKISSNLVSV